jgi:hypothetical protein
MLPLVFDPHAAARDSRRLRLRPGLWRMSPLAVAGVLVAAIGCVVPMVVGPIYG